MTLRTASPPHDLTDRFFAFVQELFADGYTSEEIAVVLNAPGHFGYDALPFLKRPSNRESVVAEWLERIPKATAKAPVVSENTGEYPATPASKATEASIASIAYDVWYVE